MIESIQAVKTEGPPEGPCCPHTLRALTGLPSPTDDDQGIFLANMSHEIRTPMNAILGYAQLLSREATLSSQHQRNLDAIIRSARHLLSLINDVLDISKIDAGRLELVPTTFDVHELFAAVETIARTKLSDKPVELHVTLDKTLPRHQVKHRWPNLPIDPECPDAPRLPPPACRQSWAWGC